MDLFRRPTVMSIWRYARPYLARMARDMAADYAADKGRN